MQIEYKKNAESIQKEFRQNSVRIQQFRKKAEQPVWVLDKIRI